MMHFGVISLFPAMFEAFTDYGITARALKNKIIALTLLNLRTFATDKHGTVDDKSYGGGPGMVLKPDVMFEALQVLKQAHPAKVIYLSPVGEKLTQAKVRSLACEPALILLCGRYEGIDQRLIDSEVDESISVGDYIVSGGELPAMILMDAITRLQPGALGNHLSHENDSFGEDNVFDYPHYTKPALWKCMAVPDVLLSGDHQAISAWRKAESLKLTEKLGVNDNE